ncbi:MAG TPA: DUF72 domain-containing protein [Gemmatimonadales bacterium]|nr:DUF72 domain-containing protein [Gemmatimonadales bacterium]
MRIGISGYNYPRWRGPFYPRDLAARHWLEYASRQFNSIELNGTFYSLKSPAVFRRWAQETPNSGFVFAVKGSRFITHNLKLTRPVPPLANFYASGILALGRKTGPFLWQLPPNLRFSAARVEAFLESLPRSSADAARLARRHDHRVKRGALLKASARVRYRHAFEVRHPSFFTPEFYELLRRFNVALVIADTAGKFPSVEELTADFVYVRLHGSTALYASDYSAAELDQWAERIRRWRTQDRDVYVYFDNDALAHAPHNARALAERVHAGMNDHD